MDQQFLKIGFDTIILANDIIAVQRFGVDEDDGSLHIINAVDDMNLVKHLIRLRLESGWYASTLSAGEISFRLRKLGELR